MTEHLCEKTFNLEGLPENAIDHDGRNRQGRHLRSDMRAKEDQLVHGLSVIERAHL